MVSGTWLVVPRPSSLRLTFRYEARAVIHSNRSEWQFRAQPVSSFFLLRALAAEKLPLMH